MSLSASQWLTALILVKLSGESFDRPSLSQDVAQVAAGLTGYSVITTTSDESSTHTSPSSLLLDPSTSTTLAQTLTDLSTFLKGSTELIKVSEKPDTLTSSGSAGDFFVDDAEKKLPMSGPTVKDIYICYKDSKWVQLLAQI